MEILKVDHSRQSTFAECPRKYYLKYCLHLASPTGSSPLRFGSTYHGMQEGLNIVLQENNENVTKDTISKGKAMGLAIGEKVWELESELQEFPEDHRTLEECKNLFELYLKDYEDAILNDWKVLHTEQYMSHLITVDNGFTNVGKSYLYEGVVDRVVEVDGMLSIEDYKSTGSYLGQISKVYKHSPQLKGYAWMHELDTGNKVYYTTHDIAHCSKRTNVKLECARYQHVLNPNDLEEFKEGLDFMVDRMYTCIKNDYFEKNLNNCSSFFGACEFVDLCQQSCGQDIPVKNFDYITKEWNPKEKVQMIEDIKEDLL